jgi:predicted metal-dependent phosphoesterase TrpH
MKIDLHVHTRASYDGMLTLPKIIRAARRRGLGGFAVTDHNAQAVFSPSETIMIIPGVEYSTDAGHVLALFYTEDVSPPLNDAGRVLLAALCEMVREKGGLLVGAHPFNGKGIRMKHTFTPETYRMLDGLETRNARALSRNKDSRRLAEEAAETYALFTTGGSDGHMAGEIGRA